MTVLRLGAYDLPPGEIILVQTLFKLFHQSGPFDWTFVTSPPYDALLVDGNAEDGRGVDVDAMAKAVLRLTRVHDADAPNTLQRPIRAERLQRWLAAIERSLKIAPAADAAAEPVALERRAPPPADADADTGAAEPDDDTRYKLRRWPPVIVLRGDANRIRLATLLSRRALSRTELVTLSRQTESDCRHFLNLLRSTGLVEQRKAMPVTTAPAAAAPAASPPFGRGLIAGIRRRLGL